jgi:hypothetical protein
VQKNIEFTATCSSTQGIQLRSSVSNCKEFKALDARKQRQERPYMLTNQIHHGERDEFTKPKSNMELRIEAWLSQERRRIEPARIATDLFSPGA